jgi:hypothetical protein
MNIDGYLSLTSKDKLSQLMKTSIGFITFNNTGGTGIFVKLPIPSKEKPLYGLLTNNHVLDADCLKPGNSFTIGVNNIKLDVVLNENDFIFTSKLIDVTFIQLNNQFINKYLIHSLIIFLDPCYDEVGKVDDTIYIFQYPKGILSFAEGRIQSISGFNYFHSASTEGGSSGSPLLNDQARIIGIHKSGLKVEQKNVATKFNVIDYAIRTLYHKRYIYDLEKARNPPRALSYEEKKQLKSHGLKETEFPNLYYCSFIKNTSLVLLFYRTNHAWYFTTRNKNNINYMEIKIYSWHLIHLYEPIENILKQSEEKLEHRHELLIMWLKLSELKYM